MMRLALKRHASDHGPAGGLLLRVRAWFATSGAATEAVTVAAPDETADAGVTSATLLAFPIHGAALLVKLAEQLRSNMAGRGSSHGAFVFALTRHPHARLTLDDSAHVEFDAGRAIYRVVVAATPDTTITVATTEFDTVVKFVAQYVQDRRSEAAPLEAVS